jgi:hypothetical protein
MHASESISCLLLYEGYVWVSLGNAMKAQQSRACVGSKVWTLPVNRDLNYGVHRIVAAATSHGARQSVCMPQ